MDSSRKHILKYFTFENTPFLTLMLLLFLTPVFFLTSHFASFQFTKSILVSVGIILALVSFLFIVIKNKSVVFVKNPILGGFGILLCAYLLSSIFSSFSNGSFVGYGFETNTFFFVLLSSVLAYLVSVSFQDSKKLVIAHTTFLSAAGVLALFQLSRLLFGPHFLTVGVFQIITDNTIGKWNELAIFFGISTLMSLCALEILKLSRVFKVILYIVLVGSLCLVAIVNFVPVWYALGIFAILFFLYQSSVFLGKAKTRKKSKDETESGSSALESRFPIIPVAILIIAVFFITPLGSDFAQGVSDRMGINNFEVRPSWTATYQIFQGTVKTSPVLGPGPNRFAQQWQLFRPDVNSSNFWNVNFDAGIGFIPSAIVETGILGFIAWALFLLSVLYTGIRAFFVRPSDPVKKYILISSVLTTFFLWAMNVVYTPSAVVLTLSFFFTGLFVAMVALFDPKEMWVVEYGQNKRTNLIVAILCVVILISSLILGYTLVERSRSNFFFQKAISAISSQNDVESAKSSILHSIELSGSDVYYRTLAQLDILKINNLIAQVSNKNEATEAEKTEFQNLFADAAEAARTAEKIDPRNFENHVVVASVYESVIPTGFRGAYDAAKAAYGEAIKDSPRNPALYLALAKLESGNKNLDKAKEDLSMSLRLKPNYADAYFFQSQLDLANGDIASAILNVQKIAVITPNDPLVFFRLGILSYDNKDWSAAINALEKSISLQPVYANAKYFLGLAYNKIGRHAEAIALFQELKDTNPDNTEVPVILANLKAGRDPFANTPSLKKPETRNDLPISESSQ